MKNIEYRIAEREVAISFSILETNTLDQREVGLSFIMSDRQYRFVLDDEALDSLIKYLWEAQDHINEFNEKKKREWDMQESERVK